jgi:outer membrane protein insertion porin family
VEILFHGTPQIFLHRVYVTGVRQDVFAAQLQRSTRLEIGTPFTSRSLQRATESLRATLRQSGYFQPVIQASTRPAPAHNQVDVFFQITLGRQAHIGAVQVSGDPGMTLKALRKTAHLKAGAKVQRDTLSKALDRLHKKYQKQKRLEASVKGDEQGFDAATDSVGYELSIKRGPLVRVRLTGAKVSVRTLRRLVPVYEEGAVDPDLLNEGDRNLRDYFQRRGYFNVQVRHVLSHEHNDEDDLLYTVVRGPRQKVVSVSVSGNRYFDANTILERLSVERANASYHYGRFSQTLLQKDVDAIRSLYTSNGFSSVTITPQVVDAGLSPTAGGKKYAGLKVQYQIQEGAQQRFGSVQLQGVQQLSQQEILGQLETRSGQPYSLPDLADDRTTILTDYYRHGFLQVALTVTQQPEANDPTRMDIVFQVQEGEQFFVRQILISGILHTRPQVVQSRVELHPGDPLDRGKLQDTQRRLYNLALFNEVDTAVVNPNGEQQNKDVLLNLHEAHRWNYDYGLGFEVQTGTPQNNCPSAASLVQLGQNPATFQCSPNGTFGASERVSFDISRINLRGKNQSITLQTAYGSLEKQATMVFDNPQFLGDPKLDFSLSGKARTSPHTVHRASPARPPSPAVPHAQTLSSTPSLTAISP